MRSDGALGPVAADVARPQKSLGAGRFVTPFSFTRMTWIKPSLLWLMHRSNWARKPAQERILAVRITRAGWEQALAQAVLTAPESSVYGNAAAWNSAFERAAVHVQWDPERTLRGAPLNHYSIQVGVGRELIRTYVDEWIVGLADITPTVHRAAGLIRAGHSAKAERLLPAERVYALNPALARRINADGPR
ncbi:DUF4291 domain-containing protein [Actinoplanes palleronii]|uniref:DUF4291 domain-containing protein n=1 Tax=Actinoplanes palleronii TaxID=113570 RepID=A0ABQ4BQD7_9ACTN|nr:DUF4291 domain-containing protein [Actinoplanes palleronii]GIE72886.1 hypothetical protein Apa02nite_089940 [Actinoplanes palleronii]